MMIAMAAMMMLMLSRGTRGNKNGNNKRWASFCWASKLFLVWFHKGVVMNNEGQRSSGFW